MTQPKRPLKVFLCHAHADRDPVRTLYTRLTNDGVDAWFDKEKLLPGQDWELEIRKAVREADVVVVCLSKQFNQRGFRQKEVRLALDTAMEMPEGEIFIIPARLEECDNLESLRKWHWVDLFEDDGYENVIRALSVRAEKIGIEFISFKEKIHKESNHTTVVDNLNWKEVSHSTIFYGRMCDSFPGVRGAERYTGEKAVERLSILLRSPLMVDASVSPMDGQIAPFWWLRGKADMYIRRFSKLEAEKVLMDNLELSIDNIVAVREFSSENKNFVYVETLPQEPTGIYKYPEDWLNNHLLSRLLSNSGYYYFEEYGLWNGKLITRQEFDDGSAIIDGRPVRVSGAELRLRYVTRYNFLLCGSDHILNNSSDPKIDIELSVLLDAILLKNKTVTDLISFVGSLPNVKRLS